MKPLHRLAFAVNASKAGALELAELLAEAAHAVGAEVKVDANYPVSPGFLADVDACCVVGGDGTLLNVVPESLKWGTPVFGINRGKLGFLATYSVEEAEAEFTSLLAGNYQLVQRSVLECKNARGECAHALNDAVIKSADAGRLIELRVECGEHLVTDYYSDGLIFCTPTGSTAYNLSAGGPIVMPDAAVLTMTPICPHTLTNRSLVFSGSAPLRIHLQQTLGHPLLTIDGHLRFSGPEYFPLSLGIAETSLALLQPLDYSHFRILRSKLKWGE